MRINYFSKNNFLLFLIFIPFIFMTGKFINCDFWNDEIYTLKHFTFVPFTTVVTDYHVPNNHIFFNLINKCYVSVFGIRSLFYLMDYPFVIRIIPLLFSIGTLLYVYFTGKKFFNVFTALAALIILLTTIPFYNFFLQVRGYSASMFFVSMMVFHAMSYESKSSQKDFILIALSVLLAVYTIPLNLYFVFSLAFYFLVLIGLTFFNNWKRESKVRFEKNYVVILLAIMTGTVFSLLFYLPVFKNVFFNEYVKGSGWFSGLTLHEVFFVIYSFLSQRYLLILFCIVGIIYALRQRNHFEVEIIKRFLMLCILFIFPFIISFVQSDNPPDRTFVIVFPMVSLLLACVIHRVVQSIAFLNTHRTSVILIIFIYCSATIVFAFNNNQKRICENVNSGIREQTIYRNYYFSCYQPNKLLKEYSMIIHSSPAPLIIYDSDYHGMREYLNKFNLNYGNADELEKTLQQNQHAYILTLYPVSFQKKMKEKYPGMKIENKNPFKDFHNLFYLGK